ncbi:MAG: VWA domain-containing protein [Pseudomonadota bacterium]
MSKTCHARSRAAFIAILFLAAFGAFNFQRAVAQETSAEAVAAEDAMLVLDASGSMWGQIDGEAKIFIAKRVVGGLLDRLPAERRLGLVAYGHNRKGDCADIEQIAPLGADRAVIRTAVDGLNPKGKTPLTDAVQFAAEQLRYTEEKATVILVSDGIETCERDPCAVGAALEQAGVDFTAHVIGFDVAEVQDQAQLQCLAENTGGRYLNASSADELSEALEETVAAPTPEPVVREAALTLRATELSGGPIVESGLSWKVQQAGGGDIVFEASDAGVSETPVQPGVYDIFVERAADGLKGEARTVEIRPGAQKLVTIALTLSFDATVRSVPETEAPVSSEIVVYWTGPDRKSDYVTIVEKGAPDNRWRSYKYTSTGNPLKLRMPTEVGDYEVRYVLGQPPKVLARQAIKAAAVEASLEAPDAVAAGSAFTVTWQGPGYSDDWITIVKPDAGDKAYTDYAYPREGDTVSLKAPLDAGVYELRYVQAGRKVIARRPIMVGAVEASVSGPETAQAGTRHPISWTGPGAKGDWITIVKPDDDPRRYTDYAYVNKGNPLVLRMPLEAGDYELRYVQNGRKVIARQAIVITAAEASLDGPASGPVASSVAVSWTGPDEKGDWITVVKPDESERRYTDYEYTKKGNPVNLTLPVTPGDYEYRYVLDGRKVVARTPVTVTDVTASVDGPASVAAGAEFTVSWEGPGYNNDWVTIVKPDAGERAYKDYKYVRRGPELTLTAPKEPGAYELRYVLVGRRVIFRQPITVTP